MRGHDAPRAGTGGLGRSEGDVDGKGHWTADHLALERDLLGHFADVLVQLEELVAGRAVDIGPPVSNTRVSLWVATKKLNEKLPLASKVLLVEQSSVRAQERVLDDNVVRLGRADVEHLATGLDISVITCK